MAVAPTPDAIDGSAIMFLEKAMELLLIVLVLVVLFGGGGYYGFRRWR
jgi:ABC-type microcin C transport system permease subunit YejB